MRKKHSENKRKSDSIFKPTERVYLFMGHITTGGVSEILPRETITDIHLIVSVSLMANCCGEMKCLSSWVVEWGIHIDSSIWKHVQPFSLKNMLVNETGTASSAVGNSI